MIFGSRAEKFVAPNTSGFVQAELFPEEKLAERRLVKTQLVKQHEKNQTKLNITHPGRNPLPDNLRREVIRLEPIEDVSGLQPVGTEVSEILEYHPGELYVKRFERTEYIRPSEDGLNAKRLIAPLPAMPLPRAIAGASLLTHLLVSKFVDHIPLHRQLGIFKRQNVSISYSTVAGWIKEGMGVVKRVYDVHCRQVLQTNYLNVDETTIKVLDKDKKQATHRGYYWVYYNTQQKLVLFDYQPGRGAVYPHAMLHNFKGYLQTDAYDGYDAFDKIEGIITLNCWAHARRKFYEAKDYDSANAEAVLDHIQRLYKNEQHGRDENFAPEQMKAYRQTHSVPILEELHLLLKDLLVKTLPQSPLGKAIAYSLRRWAKLCVYTTNGILQIDNNLVENAIRPVALGRKNYLFAGSHERAQDAAMLYSLFATCRLHNINPEQWLTNLFEKINTTKKEELYLLLPQNYEPQTK